VKKEGFVLDTKVNGWKTSGENRLQKESLEDLVYVPIFLHPRLACTFRDVVKTIVIKLE